MAILRGVKFSHCGYDLHFAHSQWSWACFHVPSGSLYVFLRDVSVQVDSPFFKFGRVCVCVWLNKRWEVRKKSSEGQVPSRSFYFSIITTTHSSALLLLSIADLRMPGLPPPVESWFLYLVLWAGPVEPTPLNISTDICTSQPGSSGWSILTIAMRLSHQSLQLGPG